MVFRPLIPALAFTVTAALAQIADYPDEKVTEIPVNYTEAKAGTPKLPDPLTLLKIKAVSRGDPRAVSHDALRNMRRIC